MLLAASESALGPTLAVIVGIGMAAQWLAWRSQIPSIILLLVAGLLLGPVFGVIDPDAFLGSTLFPVVSLAVALILFEGGLDLPACELRSTGTVVRRLITVGAVVTFFVAIWGAEQLFDISRGAAAVLAAVLVVTGPTVVGPLLRFVRPNGRTGPMLPRGRHPDRPDRCDCVAGGLRSCVDRGHGRSSQHDPRRDRPHARRRYRHRVPRRLRARSGDAALPDPGPSRQPDHVGVRDRGIRRQQRGTGGSRAPDRDRDGHLAGPTRLCRGAQSAGVQREPANAPDLGAVHPARWRGSRPTNYRTSPSPRLRSSPCSCSSPDRSP